MTVEIMVATKPTSIFNELLVIFANVYPR